jgi:hypothetical protein
MCEKYFAVYRRLTEVGTITGPERQHMVISCETTSIDRLEELSSLERLRSIEQEWLALWQRCSHATPFQSPNWLIPWCEHFGGQGELCALAFWQDGKLAGIAPWEIVTEATTGERQLLLLGTGITDYLDVLVDPEFAGPCKSKSAGGWPRIGIAGQ